MDRSESPENRAVEDRISRDVMNCSVHILTAKNFDIPDFFTTRNNSKPRFHYREGKDRKRSLRDHRRTNKLK